MNNTASFQLSRRLIASGGQRQWRWLLIWFCATLCSCQTLPDPLTRSGAAGGRSLATHSGSGQDSAPSSAAPATAVSTRQTAVQRVLPNVPQGAAFPVVPTGFGKVCQPPPVAASPTVAACSVGGCPPTLDIEHWRPDGIEGPWPPDEYLCDGGDAATRVVVSRQRRVSGLDPEDTVAHYETIDGTTVVTPSNSVCLYAPRFAAVRKISQLQQEQLLERTEWFEQPLPVRADEAGQLARTVLLPDAPVRDMGIRGPRALRDRTRGVMLDTPLRLAELAAGFEAHEDFQIIRIGIDSTPEKARLAEHVLAAIQWTHDLSPEILLDEEPAVVDRTVEGTGIVYRLDEPSDPCLRVVKVSSTPAALPGEVVEFTLRYDNLGNQTLQHVTIIDNLTTRLEYVPDSAQSDRAANFSSQLNAGESLTLRWELSEPLRPGAGGILRFKCKVR